MDLNFTDEQKMIRDTAAKFSDKEIAPFAQQWDEDNYFPVDVIKKLHEIGLLSFSVPEVYGGPGLDAVSQWLILYELGRGDCGVGTTVATHIGLSTYPVLIAGNEEQKQRWFDVMNNGGLNAACITEPGAGSDVSGIATTCKRDGDYYVLNGTKIFISNGSVADQYVVLATLDKNLKHKGQCQFMIPRNTPGLIPGKKENKLGIRASNTTEVVFEDCRVHKDNLIGKEGEGFIIQMKTFDNARSGAAAMSCGLARAAFEFATEYAKTRVQFGKPIIEFQAIKHMLADMLIKIEAGTLLALKACWMKDNGLAYNQASSIAKAYCGEMVQQVTMDAVQVLGGYGFIKDYPVEKWMRDAKIMSLYEGTTQVQKDIIGNTIYKGIR